jgi:hypothetical protein
MEDKCEAPFGVCPECGDALPHPPTPGVWNCCPACGVCFTAEEVVLAEKKS